MNIQLRKKKFGRRRFLKTAPLSLSDSALQDWQSELARLKEWLAVESQYQQVGHKTYLEICGLQISLMLEVVGVPRNLEQKALVLTDMEALEALVYDFQNGDPFNLDLETILKSAEKIRTAINLGENALSGTFHVVLEDRKDEEKIALHFFRQKDYSQKLL